MARFYVAAGLLTTAALTTGTTFGQVCFENWDCSWGQFCETPPGDCDGVGTCRDIPEACILWIDPVCGCDGWTYSNGCYAAMYGVSVAYYGECGSGCLENW